MESGFDRVGAILESHQVMLFSHRHDAIHGAGAAGKMTRVREVITASIASGPMYWVTESTAANTGVSPACRMALNVVQNVSGVVMISLPNSKPAATMLTCKGTVQALTAATCGRAHTSPTGEIPLELDHPRPGAQPA